MVKNIHDSQWTVSNIFGPYLRDLPLKIWQIYKKCSNSVNFWARKMFFFFKWVRISSEIDWYHFQGASPASNIDKDPYEVKCLIRSQCAPLLPLIKEYSKMWDALRELPITST